MTDQTQNSDYNGPTSMKLSILGVANEGTSKNGHREVTFNVQTHPLRAQPREGTFVAYKETADELLSLFQEGQANEIVRWVNFRSKTPIIYRGLDTTQLEKYQERAQRASAAA